MKSKFCLLIVLCAVMFSAYNCVISAKMERSVVDVVLTNVETFASAESGMHGRPLLQSVIGGGYKCANCIGTDCGAIC